MKIAVCCIAYNDEATIENSLRSFQLFNSEQYIVAISDTPYYGDKYPKDRTEEICKKYNVEIINGSWKKEHIHRNACLEVIDEDIDWIIWHEPDMEISLDNLLRLEHKLYDGVYSNQVVRINQDSYWKTREWIIEGDKYKPIIAHKQGAQFVNCAHTDKEIDSIIDNSITVEHYNWCEPKDILKKVKTYHHAPQIPKDWYEKHWLSWKDGDDIIMFDGNKMKARKLVL